MTLKEACDLGIACGLTTVNEAILNIEMHGISIFSYDRMRQELEELYSYITSDILNKNITDIFPELK